MKLNVIIFILFVQFMIIGSFGGLHSYYLSSKNVLIDQTNEHFEAIAQSRANHILDFFDKNKELVELMAFSIEHNELDEVIRMHPEFHEIFILDKNGKVVATTNHETIGTDFSKDLLFLGGKNRTYIKGAFYDEENGENSVAISTPIFDKAKEFSGVFVARMSMNGLNKITIEKNGLGETGEIYIINQDGYMITPSRFLSEEYTFLKLKVDTENSRYCSIEVMTDTLEHKDHERVDIFEDYRGVNVLGTHIHIPNTKLCLLAEIDESEALGELRAKLLISGIVIAIILVIIMMFFVFLSEGFIRKIVAQTSGRRDK